MPESRRSKKRGGVTVRKRQLLFLTLVWTLPLACNPAWGDFYVIAGGRGGGGVGTPINSLPYTISASGFYYITKDLNYTGSGDAIIVSVDDVTLDLMGFSLVGPGRNSGNNDGIRVTGQSNLEIRNGTLTNFGRSGIYDATSAGTDRRVIEVRATGNGSSGINLSGPSSLVQNCTASNNGGLGIQAGEGSSVVASVVYNNKGGGISAGDGSIVYGNTVYDNGSDGITTGDGSTISGNTAYANTGNGITGTKNSTITNNTATNNTQYGISVNQSLVAGNTLRGNGAGDISCTNCTLGLNHPS
jgi:parallel beta-helix repeat protein